MQAGYYGCINHIDDQVGRILEILPKETVIIFVSDHGEMLGDHQWIRKRNAFESSARVPFFMQFPQSFKLPQEQVLNHPVELMDIISQNLDQINIALDTDFWSGGQLLLGAIDNNFKAAIFSGTENVGEIETSEIELFPGTRSNIIGVRPIVDAEATVTIKTRDKLADNSTESSISSMNTTGINPVRQSGRYVKFNVKIPSGGAWSDAQGIDIVASRAGLR